MSVHFKKLDRCLQSSISDEIEWKQHVSQIWQVVANTVLGITVTLVGDYVLFPATRTVVSERGTPVVKRTNVPRCTIAFALLYAILQAKIASIGTWARQANEHIAPEYAARFRAKLRSIIDEMKQNCATEEEKNFLDQCYAEMYTYPDRPLDK
jgi:hypothetical protein